MFNRNDAAGSLLALQTPRGLVMRIVCASVEFTCLYNIYQFRVG